MMALSFHCSVFHAKMRTRFGMDDLELPAPNEVGNDLSRLKVVHADHDGAVGHEPRNDDGQQTGRKQSGVPTGAVEKLMVGGKIACFRAPGDPKAGCHRSLARRKDRTHHEDQ